MTHAKRYLKYVHWKYILTNDVVYKWILNMHLEVSDHKITHSKINMDFQIKMTECAHVFMFFSIQKPIKMSVKNASRYKLMK